MRTALKRKKKEVHRHQGNTGAMLFTLLLAILCGLAVYILSDISFMRPSREISLLISESAKKEEISPALLEAVILTESKFDKKAVSHVGAIGMMQLMPDTAEWISEESGLPAKRLERPEENIPLGAWYINYLLKEYHNNEVLALAAYNAGRGNVDQWMKDYGWKEGFSDMNQIPFPETREFVKSVTASRDRLEAELAEK